METFDTKKVQVYLERRKNETIEIKCGKIVRDMARTASAVERRLMEVKTQLQVLSGLSQAEGTETGLSQAQGTETGLSQAEATETGSASKVIKTSHHVDVSGRAHLAVAEEQIIYSSIIQHAADMECLLPDISAKNHKAYKKLLLVAKTLEDFLSTADVVAKTKKGQQVDKDEPLKAETKLPG